MRNVRGRWLHITKHALQGMAQETPKVTIENIEWMFEEPDNDDGKEVRKRIGRRTIRAYYIEDTEEIRVRGVSCTTGRWP